MHSHCNVVEVQGGYTKVRIFMAWIVHEPVNVFVGDGIHYVVLPSYLWTKVGVGVEGRPAGV